MTRLATLSLLALLTSPSYADQGGWAYREHARWQWCNDHSGDTNRCKPTPIDRRPVVWVPR